MSIRARRGESPEEGTKQANRYIRLPNSRERITANILSNRPWYRDLTFVPFWQRDQIIADCKKARESGLHFLGIHVPGQRREEKGDSVSPERLWFLKLQYFERTHIMELSEEERMWDSPEEKRLLEILRDRALRRFLNEEECAVRFRGGSRSLAERWDDVIANWHRRFMRAKTRPLFRAVIHEYLGTAQRRTRRWDEAKKLESRVGGTVFPSAKDDRAFQAWFWREVNDSHGWQRIRDLALLALVTFSDGRLATKQD
jgi:CRISPR-associated protein Cas8a1/Csx13